MKRTTVRLNDGRELIYFDERDDADRSALDQRRLPEPAPPAELRYDPIFGEWVSVTTHRQDRTFLPPCHQCPLCPSTSDYATEIPAADYDVVVFENRYPSFSWARPMPDDPTELGLADPPVDPVKAVEPGWGRCEVVCFTSDHHTSFAKLPRERVRTVVEVWAERTAELSELPFVKQVFCFENRGEEVGVTLNHPHGQIYAYPFITPQTERMLDSARRYRNRTARNLFADVLASELRDCRVVSTNNHWVAFVPAAARWPFEVHLYPRRQVPDIPALNDSERDAFVPIYRDLLRRFDALFQLPMPYISGWHQAPVRQDRDLAYLHLQLFSNRRAAGKLKYPAGSEAVMGAFINDMRPEDSARMLRDAVS